MGETAEKTLEATERRRWKRCAGSPDVIMPFPGGVARSGSKIGSKYKGASASTNDHYCPTLKGAVDSVLSPEIASVLERSSSTASPAILLLRAMRAMRWSLPRSSNWGRSAAHHASVPAITAESSAGTIYHLKDLVA